MSLSYQVLLIYLFMGFTNISSFSSVPPCEFIEDVLKETTDGDKIVVSFFRRSYVPTVLPPYDTFSVENCQAAGINLESVSPYVIDGAIDPAFVDSELDSLLGSDVSDLDDSNE